MSVIKMNLHSPTLIFALHLSPLNTVLKFTPAKGGGWAESRHRVLPSPCPSEVDLCSSADSSCHDVLSPESKAPQERRTWIAGQKSPPPIWGDHFVPLKRSNSTDERFSPERRSAEQMMLTRTESKCDLMLNRSPSKDEWTLE
jgi:hypothetical protein